MTDVRSANIPALIPSPRSLEVTSDAPVTLPSRMTASGTPEQITTVAAILEGGTGLRVVEAVGEEAFLVVTPFDGQPGSYELEVTDARIALRVADFDGLVAGLQTLRQLMPDWVFGLAPLPGAPVSVPQVRISDAPRFAWRGMHLDVGRYFEPLGFLYRFVDLLAMHKFNRFQLHLNDDQGWRFEVKRYPKLTEVGSWRTGTRLMFEDAADGIPVGGFYTQDQLRALVGYAKSRGVVIVPEIDVPGHTRAMLAAYPEWGQPGVSQEVAVDYGVHEQVMHLTDDAVAAVKDILDEVMDVFDSPWIHIGGDECPTVQWTASDEAAELARERGLSGPEALQPWFTEQLVAYVNSQGRRPIGWDEIIDQGEVPGAIVMSWRGEEPGRRAIRAGHPVIMATGTAYYLDHVQSDLPTEAYTIPSKPVTWQDVARFDPTDGISSELLDGLLGIQGQVWTEYLYNADRVEYQAFPRASVIAEVAWSGQPSVAEFEPRLRAHLRRLDAMAVNYRPLDGPLPWQQGGTGRWRYRRN